MDKKSDNAYELDYIFSPQNSEDFENVHVSLKVGEERICLIISSDKMIEPIDLENIIDGLKSNTFKRMNLKFGKDCDVIFITADQKFNITFDENTHAVTGMNSVL